jgi:hypothetical protein
MAKAFDLEGLREVFKDQRTHVAIGSVLKLDLEPTRSVLRAKCRVLGQGREVIARIAWSAIGPDAGLVQFPVVNDLVLLVFAEGDDEAGFVIARLSNDSDTIPETAIDGATVLRALAGKSAWITSDTQVNVSRGDTVPTENFVLGQMLKALFEDILTELKGLTTTLSTHTHVGNLGYPTAPPTQASAINNHGANFDALKASPVQDEEILSDLAFVEK